MIEVQLEGCIYELNFGYNTKMEGYTNLNSDIPEFLATFDEKISINNQNQFSKELFEKFYKAYD